MKTLKLNLILKDVISLYYNLDSFGKKVSSIRKSLNLTREELSNLSLVSVSTIRKIETGKHLPNHEILEDLSNILKADLNKVILDYRLDDYKSFNDIVNRMESKFDKNEYHTLENEYNDFRNLLISTNNQYYQKLIKQLMLLVESMLLNKVEKRYNESLDRLVKAMQLFTPDFSLTNYNEFVYNQGEIRILMNVALLLKKLDNKEESLKIIEFCMEIVNSNDEIYPKLCHNLSGEYRGVKDYKNSLKYADLGIKYCQENRNFNGLNLLYYNKGVAEYSLGCERYMDSLNKSISFCDILGQDKLREIIIHKCKKFYNIELK